jgi:retron-type reverse transcriptase
MLLNTLYEPLFIAHSYATRKNKGTHAAVRAAQSMLRCNAWYLKADIRKYFDSIDHPTMLQLIAKKVKDNEFLEIVSRIIENEPGSQGLPIGNLTSQFLANVYLHELDIYVLHTLKPCAYIRYMDDFVLFDKDPQQLQADLYHIESFLQNTLLLQLKAKATRLNQAQHGLGYLGTRIFRGTIRIGSQNLRRCLRRLRYRYYQWQRGFIQEEKFLAAANSIVAY